MKDKTMRNFKVKMLGCVGFALAVLPVLILAGCNALLEPPAAPKQDAPAGRAIIRIGEAGEGAARSLVPAAAPNFTKYELAFTAAGKTGFTRTLESGADRSAVTTGGYEVTLEEAAWTVEVSAFVSGPDGAHRAAARGTGSLTVSAGNPSPSLAITLNPLAMNSGGRGNFAWNLTLSGVTGVTVTGTITPVVEGNPGAPVNLSGISGSLELASGYYRLGFTLTKGNTSAGVYRAVHIYPGLTTTAEGAEFTFTGADFSEQKYLAGTAAITGVPETVEWVTVQPYQDSAFALPLSEAVSTTQNGSWFLAIPANTADVYFKVTMKLAGSAAVNYLNGGRELGIPANGRKNIALSTAYTTETGPAIKVLFDSGNTKTVNLAGLGNNTVYLVKVNKSANAANSPDTGSVSGVWANWSPSAIPAPDYIGMEEEIPRWLRDIQEFNANPPRPMPGPSRRTRALTTYNVGQTKNFWVKSGVYASPTYISKSATLYAQGTYGNVWVLDDDYDNASSSSSDGKINLVQAQALASKFDQIYPVETGLIGYEYGGDPSDTSTYGGRDGDPRIQILVYDIPDAGGYFSGVDYYLQSRYSNSNEAEIFYLDTGLDGNPNYYYSTLVHEFQHMINFNVKSVQNSASSASWYNEMLSEMAEDVISPLIGILPINRGHPIGERIGTFLRNYHTEGITEWGTLSSNSYAKGFAFGAYLMRNYGGAELLQKILQTNTSNTASLDTALGQLNPGVTFLDALERYGEAFIHSGSAMPAGMNSFDKTVTKTIGPYTYTTTRFNIWDERYYLDGGYSIQWGGPKIFSLAPLEMRPHSVLVHSSADWKNMSGSLSITLNKPAGNDVVLYLMVK